MKSFIKSAVITSGSDEAHSPNCGYIWEVGVELKSFLSDATWDFPMGTFSHNQCK